ncbi:MAG: NADH-quinone oxidoreductase subunit NuoE [Wenzhouxiangellaceae bacterium]
MQLHESPASGKSALLSEDTRAAIDHWKTRFPDGLEGRRSAIIQSLVAAQHQNEGYLTGELMDAVADYLDVPPVWVYEVASFYSMLETKPVGRNSISICTNISCMLCGADKVVDYIEDKLGTKMGETTPDGRIFLKIEEECVAACTGAPMMMVNHRFYENLTPASVDEILDGLE